MRIFKRIIQEHKAICEALPLLPPPINRRKIISYFDMWWCVAKYGALADDYISLKFFEKSAKERAEYVTAGNKRLFYQGFYTNEAREVLANKNLFSKKYSKFVTRDWIYSEDATIEQVKEFIEAHKEVVVKPTNSTWGIGVGVVDVNSMNSILEDIKKGNHYMIEEKIVNHPDVAKLNPSSLQTLRVETCLDSKGEFHLLNVLLMIGTKKLIVSNCHSGGVMCHIDMNTGVVDKDGYNPKGYWLSHHPETGIKFIGYKVPTIENLEAYIKEVVKVMPEARYVGWDVALTPNGFELIEGNFCPGQCTQICDGIPKYKMLKSYL